jgi:hypothetical protein
LNNGLTLAAGQALHFYGKAVGAINSGDGVQFAGVQGDHILIKKSVAAELQANPSYFIGIAATNIADEAFGYVIWFGYVQNLDTTGLSAGQILYANTNDGAANGSLTTTKPLATKGIIQVAAVIKLENGNANNGIFLVRPQFLSVTIDQVAGLQDALNSLIGGNKLLGLLDVQDPVNIETTYVSTTSRFYGNIFAGETIYRVEDGLVYTIAQSRTINGTGTLENYYDGT